MMQWDKIKNSNNKTIWYVDGYKKRVEIVKKGIKTVISFNKDNSYEVVNSQIDKKN